MEYCENTLRTNAFIAITNTMAFKMSLLHTIWLSSITWRSVGRFSLFMHKWNITPSPNSKCGIPEQTEDEVLIMCCIQYAPYGT